MLTRRAFLAALAATIPASTLLRNDVSAHVRTLDYRPSPAQLAFIDRTGCMTLPDGRRVDVLRVRIDGPTLRATQFLEPGAAWREALR
jgi:hypothetical protein